MVDNKGEKQRGDETENFPRLVFYFNQKSLGRLYQLIDQVNRLGSIAERAEHPEKK